MKGFFEPQSVAVIGASADPLKGGFSLFTNLKDSFKGRLYPVNPKYRDISGIPCFESVDSLPESVDLAIIFVPSFSVPDILEECGKKGIRRAMIQSAGFAETGARGRLLQDRCISIARAHHMRIWGPNCMGIVDGITGMVASFMLTHIWKGKLIPGGVSLIVQSGMLSAGFLIQILSEGYFGLNKACSIGNRSDVNECDLLEFFAEDRRTEVIAMYLESLADPARFRAAIKGLKKPVVLLKGGTSKGGARAAMSHTASLAGDNRIAEGLFRQTGIHRAEDFVELMDLTRALHLWKGRTGGRRIAIVTFSGAAGIVSADHLSLHGMSLAPLTNETRLRLRTIFPSWMDPENPVDIWPATERSGRDKALRVTLEALVEDPGVDGIFVHLFVEAGTLHKGLNALEPLEGYRKPVVIWAIGDTRCFRELRLKASGMTIPVYLEIARCVKALGLMANRSIKGGS